MLSQMPVGEEPRRNRTQRLEALIAQDVDGIVVSHEGVADQFRRLEIELGGSIPRAKPGQFVQLQPTDLASGALLRIPLSISHVDGEASRFSVLYEIVGPKSLALSRLAVGDSVSCLGPLGHPFPDPPPGARVLLVGGGIGVPPLIHLGVHLRQVDLSPILIVGARHAGKHLPQSLLLPATSDLRQATDDGTLGHHGFVTDLLAEALADGPDQVIYTCGPHPMMAAVAKAAKKARILCYASLEEYMACGFGVCVGCVVERSSSAVPAYEKFSRVCVDGPVYDAEEIVW